MGSCIVALLLLVVGFSNAEFYTKRSGVIDLNQGNFKSLVLSGKSNLPWIVEFYAPWCGHCQQLKPEYVKMAAKLKGIVNVGAVDCDNKANGAIASQYGIRGFPTIKVFTSNGKVHDYNGARTSGAMASFVLNMLDSRIQTVSASNEAKFISSNQDKPRFILFTDKPQSTPLYKSISAQYGAHAIFGEVKNDKNLIAKYGVTSFPTFIVFKPNESSHVTYDGEKSPEAIRNFIKSFVPEVEDNQQQESSTRKETPKSKPSSSAGSNQIDHNIKLTSANFDSLVLNSHSVWMVEFYAPWCGHCKNLAPEWQKAADSLKGNVKFGAVDATVETSLASRYGIKGYPTIKVFPALKEKKLNHVEDYQGQRTAKAISAFASSQLPDFVVSIDSLSKVEGWINKNVEKNVVSFLLLSEKSTTPTLLKSLALEFKNQISIAAMLGADKDVLNAFTGSEQLSLPVFFAMLPSAEGSSPKLQAYQGPFGFQPLSDFIKGFLSSGQSESQEILSNSNDKSVVLIDSQESFESACINRLGLCVIAFAPSVDGHWENAVAYESFQKASVSLASKPCRFMWADPGKHKAFADEFRLPDDGSIGLVALHPGKKRYAVFVGVFDVEGISEFLDNLLRGRIRTSLYTSLPKLHNDDLEEAFVEGSTESCDSSPDDVSGQCSMPKDEL